MNLKEAIKLCDRTRNEIDDYEYKKDMENLLHFLQELEQYRKIGTVSRCKDAVWRQTPIEADYEGDSCDENGDPIYDTWICPNCGEKYEIGFDDYDYCPNCGQRVTVHEVSA